MGIFKGLNNLGTGNSSDPLFYWYQLYCVDDKTAWLNRYEIKSCTSSSLCPDGIPQANVQLYKDCKDAYLNQCPHTAPYPPKNCTFDEQSLPVICGGKATNTSWVSRCKTSKAISLPCLDQNRPPPACALPEKDYAGVIAANVIAFLAIMATVVFVAFYCCKKKKNNKVFAIQ